MSLAKTIRLHILKPLIQSKRPPPLNDPFCENPILVPIMRFSAERTGGEFATQSDLYAFSISEFRRFWLLLLDWVALPIGENSEPLCTSDLCDNAEFPRICT